MASDEWEDRGRASRGVELLRGLIDQANETEFRNLHNNRTGEDFVVFVEPSQTLHEAISNGQYKKIDL